MKHFSASLIGAMNAVDEGTSQLTIGTDNGNDDSLVIHNEQVITPAGDKIPGTDRGLVIIPTVSASGSTHVIGADGREIDIADFAGGGAHSVFNPTLHFLPAKTVDDNGQTEWEDSLVSLAGGTSRVVTRNLMGTADPAGIRSYQVVINIAAASQAEFNTDYPVSQSRHVSVTIAGINGGNPIDGTIRNIGVNQALFTPSSGSFGGVIADNAAVTIPGSATTITTGHNRVQLQNVDGSTASGLHVTGTTTIGNGTFDTTANRALAVTGDAFIDGDLTITGDLQRVTETTLAVEDKYIIANHSETGSSTEDGGLLVERAVPGNQTSNTGAANTLGTHAGIRYNEGDNQWETSVGTTNVGGVDDDWVPIGSGTLSSVQVAIGSGLQINSMDTATISAGNANFEIHDNSEFVTTAITASGGSNAAAKTGGASLALNTLADTTGDPDRGVGTATSTHYLLAANISNAGALTWVAPAAGTVRKHAENFTKANDATGTAREHVISAGTHMLGTDNTDYTVLVYEVISASDHRQVLPDEIAIAAAAGTALGATRALGDVIVRFPENTPAGTFRIVIKG